jgi:hypothetical protein
MEIQVTTTQEMPPSVSRTKYNELYDQIKGLTPGKSLKVTFDGPFEALHAASACRMFVTRYSISAKVMQRDSTVWISLK